MRCRFPVTVGLALAAAAAFAQDKPAPEEPACVDRYHVEGQFLANPDESVLIAATIGWSRNQHHRLLWDERLASVARRWSGTLRQTGLPDDKSVPLDRLRFELQQLGVTDIAVLPYSALGPPEKVPEGMLPFLDDQAPRGRYTHFGIGVERTPDQQRMVTTLLLSRRPAWIDPLPVCPRPGARLPVKMQLLRGYNHPQWLMTTPRGNVEKGVLLYEEGCWRGELPLDAGRGEYTLEMVVQGPTGPEVAALFPLFAGSARPSVPRVKLRPAPNRYRTPEEAEAALVLLVNANRERQGLPPLQAEPALSAVAREHSMQLLFERHATHRTAQTGALLDRLHKAGIPFVRALENVSLSPSPETAHDRFMESPGHRLNVLDTGVTQLGVGVAMERNAVEDLLAVTEVFIEPPDADSAQNTVKRICDLINQRRRSRGRFAVGLDTELSRLARQSARRLAALGRKADAQVEGEAVLAEVEELGLEPAGVGLRYYRTTDPGQVIAAPEVLLETINRLGVGVAPTAEAAQTGELWIALIFAGR